MYVTRKIMCHRFIKRSRCFIVNCKFGGNYSLSKLTSKHARAVECILMSSKSFRKGLKFINLLGTIVRHIRPTKRQLTLDKISTDDIDTTEESDAHLS